MIEKMETIPQPLVPGIYHKPGIVTVAPDVLLTIVRLTTLSVPGVSRMGAVRGGVNRLFRRGEADGVRLVIEDDDRVSADLYVVMFGDVNIRETSLAIQSHVARAIHEIVGMQSGEVTVHVEDIDFAEEIGA